jgi:hypothetical protein
VKEQFHLNFLSVSITLVLLIAAGRYGLEAVAIAAVCTALFTLILGMQSLKKALNVQWKGLAGPALQSLVLTLSVIVCAGGTLALIGEGWRAPRWSLVPAGVLSLVGWYVALRLLKHPLAEELARAVRRLMPSR